MGSQGVATPISIFSYISQNFFVLIENFLITLKPAFIALLFSLIIATTFSVLGLMVNCLKSIGDVIGLVFYVIPLVALGPIISALLEPDVSVIVVAVITVVFPTYLIISSKLSSAISFRKQLFDLYETNSLARIQSVILPFYLLAVSTALRIGIPWAFLGAMLGEYFGAQKGMGVFFLGSLSQGSAVPIWSAALFVIFWIGILTLIASFIERKVAVYLDETEKYDDALGEPTTSSLVNFIICLMSVVLVWFLVAKFLPEKNFVLKGPLEIAAKIPQQLHTHIIPIAKLILLTFLWAVIGGVVSSLVVVFWIFSGRSSLADGILSAIFLPLQYVPIIAAIPLIGLVFGRGIEGTIFITMLATIYPIYVAVDSAVKKAPTSINQLNHLFGNGTKLNNFRLKKYWFFAGVLRGLRAGFPRAILGVMLAEVLLTAQGIGWGIFVARGKLDYWYIWYVVCIILILSLILDRALILIEERFNKEFVYPIETP